MKKTLEKGLKKNVFSSFLVFLYKLPFLRFLVIKLANGLEGHEFTSATLRRILKKYHDVTVGAYSYGPCMKPGEFPPGIVVERYVSIAPGVLVYPSNHPMERLSMHLFFYCKSCGYVDKNYIERQPVRICADAWIGANAILTHNCTRVGVGAVIGAGSIVTKDVPDFAIVAGSPAKLLRYRFPEKIREKLLASRWWEKPVEECLPYMSEFLKPLDEDSMNNPRLQQFLHPRGE
jgi:virginiamycin A acetyltransferase